MKRAALLLAIVLLPPHALAFNEGEAFEAVSDLTPACVSGHYGDDLDGKPLSEADIIDACRRLMVLHAELNENGYCLKAGVWTPCR